MRTEEGEIADAVDIRKPVGIEMEFEVLKPGHVLVPGCHFFNEEGVYVFAALDHDPVWQRRRRLEGRYLSTAWVPGNMLSEGTIIVGAAIAALAPAVVHFYERDAVAFQVVDSLEGDSARGDYSGNFPGVVRPLLKWTTQYIAESKAN